MCIACAERHGWWASDRAHSFGWKEGKLRVQGAGHLQKDGAGGGQLRLHVDVGEEHGPGGGAADGGRVQLLKVL